MTLHQIGGITFEVAIQHSGFEKGVAAINANLDQLAKRAQEIIKPFGKIGDATAEARGEFDRLVDSGKRTAGALDSSGKAAEVFSQRMSKIAGESSKAGTAVGPTGLFGKAVGGMQGLLGKASGALSKYGLTVRDVSIILGSGLLSSGIALIARELLRMAEAAISAAIQLAQLGDRVQHLREQVSATFGKGAAEIEEFAHTSAQGLGLTEEAALKLEASLGLLFESFGVGEKNAAALSTGLLQAAEVFHRVDPAGRTFEQTLSDLQNAVQGNVEALRTYGVPINEVTLKNVAAANGIQLFGESIDGATKTLLAEILVLEQAQDRLGKFGQVHESLADKQAQLGAAIDQLRTRLGEALAPALKSIVDGLGDFIESMVHAVDAVIKFNKEHPEFLNFFKSLATREFSRFAGGIKLIIDEIKLMFLPIRTAAKLFDFLLDHIHPLRVAFEKLGEAVNKALRFLRGILDHLPGPVKHLVQALTGLTPASDKAADSAKKHGDAEDARSKSLENAKQKAIDEAKALQDASDARFEVVAKAIEAQKKLAEAEEDGDRRVAEAKEKFQRVREDNERKFGELILRNRRAAEDAARAVNEAEQALADARESRRRRLEDAQEKVDDAERAAFRANRTAQERLEDFERDHTRKVIDLKEKLGQAAKQEARDTTEAQIAIETALRHGDEAAFNVAARELGRAKAAQTSNSSLRDAEKALAREQEDHAIELKRLQRDLIETREDGARSVARAVRDQDRAEVDGRREVERAQLAVTKAIEAQTRAHEDAIRALNDYEVESNRALVDAKRGIRDAERERERAIREALAAFEELALSIGDTIEELQTLIDFVKAATSAAASFSGGANELVLASQHAAGGPIEAGELSIVGEKGPELIIPRSAGTVISNDQLISALKGVLSGGGSGSGTSHTWNVTNNVDEDALAAAIEARLIKGVG